MEELFDYLRGVQFHELRQFIPNLDEMHLHICSILIVAAQAHADEIIQHHDNFAWYRASKEIGKAALSSDAFRAGARRHIKDIVQLVPIVSKHMTLLYETDYKIAYTFK